MSQCFFQKEKSKGQKQVLEENASTLFFYRAMSLGATGIYMFCCWLLFNNYSATDQVSKNLYDDSKFSVYLLNVVYFFGFIKLMTVGIKGIIDLLHII